MNMKYNIPSELKMKMEQIRTFLDRGRAAVMIGSGFSKNAQTSTLSYMKDWSELTDVMFNQLFVDDADKHINLKHEPLKLAQMYEACFGQNAMDSLIQNSLPDSTTYPGELHLKLMQMPWKDVFTTNYDTLLERAALDSDRPYTVVTNRDTLLYSDSPRIIKLHGSFPDIRPYIITEEDFRTYPQKYPAFVNTVRQALMENLFCLIGFSGEDPNFLQWIGWLRDVMRGEQMPVYLVTYDPYMHESQRRLLRDRGVDVINLATIEGLNYSSGLKMFLDYVGAPHSSDWTGKVSLFGISEKEHIISVTKKLKTIRESYPNWLFLPIESINYFDRLNEDCWRVKDDVLEALSIREKFQFLYEIVWRYSISLTPIRVKWVWDAMCSLDLHDENLSGLDKEVVDVKLTLLRMCRFFSEHELWEKTISDLESLSAKISSRQLSALYYEKCLHGLAQLNYDGVRAILETWEVTPSDAQCVLWKASVMLEVGQKSEMLNLLNIASQRLKRSILSSGTKENVATTYLEAMSELMYIAEPINYTRLKNTKLTQLKRSIIALLQEAKEKPAGFQETTHEFGIGRLYNTWNSSINIDECIHYAFRYLMLQESVGCPTGLPHRSINEKWISQCVSILAIRLPQYILGLILRSGNGIYVKRFWNREVIDNLPDGLADKIFEQYKENLQIYLRKHSDRPFAERVENVLVPVLSNLTTKLDIHHVEDMYKSMMAIYDANLIAFENKSYRIVQDSLFVNDKARANTIALLSKIVDNPNDSLVITPAFFEFTPIHDKVLDLTNDALSNPSEHMQTAALERIWYILRADITSTQRERVCQMVRVWRNGKISNRLRESQYFSYQLIPYDAKHDHYSPEDLVLLMVSKINKMDLTSLRGTVLMDMRQNIGSLMYLDEYITPAQHEMVLSKIYTLLNSHADTLLKDDSSEIFGGFRTEVRYLASVLMVYMSRCDIVGVSQTLLTDFMDCVVRYNESGVPMIGVMVKLNQYTNYLSEEDMKKHIEDSLLNQNDTICWNGLQAVKMLSKNSPLKTALLTMMLDYASYAQTSRVADYLHVLSDMVIKGVLRKDKYEQRIDAMLDKLALNINKYNVPMESKVDISYWANYLAGAMAAKWCGGNGVMKWREISKDSTCFNDVRVAFDLGQVAVKGRKSVEKLILKEG